MPRPDTALGRAVLEVAGSEPFGAPDAEVTFNRGRFAARARLPAADERARVWPILLQHWPNREDFRPRSGRERRALRLERVGQAAA